MRRRTLRSLSLLLLLASTVVLACDLGALLGGKPSIVFVSPPHGSQFREGEDVAFQSTATDSSGVTRVELVVDGVVVRTDSAPGQQGQQSLTLIQTWKATQGSHTISVRAYNSSSAVSDPASISISVSPAIAQVPTPLPPTTLPPTPVPPTLPPPPPPATAAACTDNAAFVADVTVPDGTALAPGQAFNKIWRVRNSGTCTWGTGYQLAFVGGEAMAATTTIAVPYTAPGATADLLVPMTASTTPGGHAGQWRLKNASGALFGITVSVSITVVSPGAPPPPASACSGTPNIASFTATSTSITAGSSTTLQWGAVTNADSVEIDQGIGGVPAPGDRNVSPGSTTTYTMTAHCGANTATRQVTITVNAVTLPVPAQLTPADGTVFRVFPRVATFSWSAVSSGGSVTYGIEIQINTGTWQSKALQTGLTGTSYTMSAFAGDNPGRWRVWASSPVVESAKSAWRSFSFNTSASQYSGTWLNNDSGTSGITRIIITNSGQTLNVHPYGKCTPTDCDWGTKSATFNGEPFVVTGFPVGHQLSITLTDAAGASLRAVDSGGPSGGTYNFHK